MAEAQAASGLRQQIERDGYAVVRRAVPKDHLEAVIADIFAHVGARPDDPESWYQDDRIGSAGMVEMYHYQSMWNNRQHPAVHAAFAEVFGDPRLWVSIDRVNLKPPADPRHPKFDFKGMMHWDVDIERYPDLRFGVQGVLALTDTDESMGGFHCMPALYRDLADALARRREAGEDVRRPDRSRYPVVRVAADAGDLVIWSTLLPHGNGENRSAVPRLAQYISMSPAGTPERAVDRIALWRHNRPPQGAAFPGDPRGIEQARERPAELTALGRRLLGLDPWT